MTLQPLDDPGLIALIAQKSEAALSELYDRYGRLVFSVAIGIIRRPADAEEVTLDVFTRVWNNAHVYRPEQAQVHTWLTRLARNRAIDILRRENVRPMKTSISWSEVWPEPAVEGGNPETEAQLAVEKERVRQAVATLPDNQKEVLALAYFGGYSHSEIAAELDLPLGTVKARIRSAMQKLRAHLRE